MRKSFHEALMAESPLQIAGVINAYTALLAVKAGMKALYLSGSGVAVNAFGLPDLGLTTFTEVLGEAQRITDVVDVPLLVDIDTGWGNALTIKRVVRSAERCNVSALQIEDQIQAKRCGHRPNKEVVAPEEMGARLKAMVDSRTSSSLFVIARTDAIATEGLLSAVERAQFYIECGADAIFPEAVKSLDEYNEFVMQCKVPVLANLTEFGQTPLFSLEELGSVGVKMALYPLTAFRVISKSALAVYETLRSQGTQSKLLPLMQTRSELYEVIKYHESENYLDELGAQKPKVKAP